MASTPTGDRLRRCSRKPTAAGATIVKEAQDVFWDGHSSYFADPEGYLWEVAWNPCVPLAEDGSLKLPD